METRSDSAFIDLAAAVWKRKWMVLGISIVALLLSFSYFVGGGTKDVVPAPGTMTWVKTILRIPTPTPIVQGIGSSTTDLLKVIQFWNEPLAESQVRVRIAKFIIDGSDIIDNLNSTFDLKGHYKVTSDNPVKMREEFRRHFKTDIDIYTESLIFSVGDPDPIYAKKISEAVLKYINERISSMVAASLDDSIKRIYALSTSSSASLISQEIQMLKVLAMHAKELPSPVSNIIEIETYTIPVAIQTDKKKLVAIAGAFSAVFFSFFLAVVLEALDRARHDADTVARFKALSARRKN